VFFGSVQNPAVATVGDNEISSDELANAFNRQVQNLQQRIGAPIDREQAIQLGVMQQSLQELIVRRLMALRAQEMGLTVTDEALRDLVTNDPAFQSAGQFDRSRFDQLLRLTAAGLHWQQRLSRSRYEVEQSRRQYAAVDPEYRLVARELERRWDETLRADEQLQADYARFARNCPIQLSQHEREQVLALAKNLPALWHADSTTPEDRQAIARLLLEQVTVTVEGNTDRVDVELRWAGGFVSRHTLYRPVQTYERLSNYDELVQRIDTLRATRKTLSQIAATLNNEGFRPPKRTRHFTQAILSRFLRERGVRTGPLPRGMADEQHLEADEWWLADLAAQLKMPIATMHRWQRVGWVTSRKVTAAGGRWAIYADTAELVRLRRLRDSPRGWPQPYPGELITPKGRNIETEATRW